MALSQGPHIKNAAVARRWQRVGDMIGSEYQPLPPATEVGVLPLVP